MSDKKTIIIIEDEFSLAKMVKMRLESVGYRVDIATDAYSGTQKIMQNKVDLIVLDLMMPAGGGFKILERIRGIPEKAMIPVIIVTGKTIDDEIKAKANEYCVEAMFMKPYKSEEFVQKIKTLIPP